MRQQIYDTISAKVRAYLGLSQQELSICLGISRAMVAQAETKRCDYSTACWVQLLLLMQVMPPPLGPAPPDEEAAPQPLPATGLDATLLQRRLRSCEHEARELRRTLEHKKLDPKYARRWQRALPVLEATLPADPGTDTRAQRRLRQWLPLRSTDMAYTVDALATTELRLVELRLRLLETEATELRRWLAALGSPGAEAPTRS